MPLIGRRFTPGLHRAAWGFMQSGDFPVPVLHLKCGENTGTEAKDSSPEGNDGTIEGASWAKGYLGPGLSFDGIDNYVDCGDDSSMQPASTITVLFRAYIDRSLTLDDMDNWAIFMNIMNGVRMWYTATDKRVSWSSVFTVAGTLALAYIIPATGWYDFGYTFDGETYTSYVNGTLNKSGSIAADTINYTGPKVYIGGTAAANSIQAIIDEVLIFDEVLTAAQIRQVHQGYR